MLSGVLQVAGLINPSLIGILMYRPSSCTICEFDDIIIKVNRFIFFL